LASLKVGVSNALGSGTLGLSEVNYELSKPFGSQLREHSLSKSSSVLSSSLGELDRSSKVRCLRPFSEEEAIEI